MKAVMKVEKTTRNTVKFTEMVENEYSVPMIGTIYIPKSTLSSIGWKEGMKITIDVGTEE